MEDIEEEEDEEVEEAEDEDENEESVLEEDEEDVIEDQKVQEKVLAHNASGVTYEVISNHPRDHTVFWTRKSIVKEVQ